MKFFTLQCFPRKEFSSRGFTLLLSVLIASLLLAIGLAIFNIAIKEFLLSSSVRESQSAFYAADTGIECALFWDFEHSAFNIGSVSQITCGGQSAQVGGGGFGNPSTFTLSLADGERCVTVTVTKLDTPRRTIVESRGHNTCNVNDPRRVERAIRARY